MWFDDLAYWVGVATISLSTVAVILVALYWISTLAIVITGVITDRLRQTYRHIQLYYFMEEMKQKGRAQMRKDYLDEEDK